MTMKIWVSCFLFLTLNSCFTSDVRNIDLDADIRDRTIFPVSVAKLSVTVEYTTVGGDVKKMTLGYQDEGKYLDGFLLHTSLTDGKTLRYITLSSENPELAGGLSLCAMAYEKDTGRRILPQFHCGPLVHLGTIAIDIEKYQDQTILLYMFFTDPKTGQDVYTPWPPTTMVPLY